MNISFSATTEQVRQHQKHVTRRIDKSLRLAKKKPGDILQGIERGQGIKKGEHVVKLDQIVILEVNREPLDEIIRRPQRKIPEEIFPSARKGCRWYRCDNRQFCPQGCLSPQRYRVPDWQDLPCTPTGCYGICETDLEGFPDMKPEQFVETFCKINKKCTPDTEITRVLFDYVDPVKGWLVAK